MQFIFDNLEGFIAAIALIVSIVGAAISRYFTKKDMLKQQHIEFNKELYYSFFELIFSFLELSSPEFVDDIYDSVLDEYQFNSDDSLEARIDKAYVEISKRKLKLRLHIIKMETFASSDMKKSEEVLVEVNEIHSSYSDLLDLYAEQLKTTYDNNLETQIDCDLLKDETNKYEDRYFEMVEWIKKYMKQMKFQLLT